MFVTTFSYQAFTCSIRLDTTIIFIWNFKSTLKIWLKETLCYKKKLLTHSTTKIITKDQSQKTFSDPRPLRIWISNKCLITSLLGFNLWWVIESFQWCLILYAAQRFGWTLLISIPFHFGFNHSSINEWNWAHKRFESIAKKCAISSLFLQLSAIVANNMELIFRNGKMIPLKLEIKSKIIVGSENREA